MFLMTGAEPDFVVERSSDWAGLAGPGLDLIVDPMIYRTAEVFVAGPPGRLDDEPELAWRDRLAQAWRPISQNLQELVSFLDLLVYMDRLPMIDYLYTFPEQFPGFGLYETCNQVCGTRVLSTIKVAHAPYMEARDYAIEALLDAPAIERDPATARDIDDELTAFDHAWRPRLPELNPAYAGDEDVPGRAVDSFVYGGTLFGVYAKLAATAHLLQSKRAGLLGSATTIGHYATEPDLFAAIDAHFTGYLGDKVQMPALPSVLPLLLIRGVDSPLELLQAAAALRATTMAEETRDWRRRLVADWRAGRPMASSVSRDLRRLADRLRAAAQPARLPQPDLREIFGVEPTSAMTAYLLKAIPWDRLRLWALPNVPGKNHLKLLHRLHSAHARYATVGHYWKYLDQVLFRIWVRAAAPQFD
jgi:hypothetical protein